VSERQRFADTVTKQLIARVGKGYASRLLRLLHYHLADNGLIPPFPAQWGAPPPSLPPTIASALPKAIGSSLWSDVGSTFYSRCTIGPDRPGWVVHDHMCQELTWKILPPSDDADRKPCKWIYQSDLPEIGKILSAAARTRLQAGETVPKTFFQQDPTSKGILSFVPVRGSYSEGFAEPHEPSGVRMALPNGEETIILFTAYNTSIAPRLLITCIHNLHLEHLPSLLRLLDTVGSGAGRTEGWVWDLDPSSELVKAWQAMPEREVRASRRAERMGHLLGVAWYGAEEEMENAEFVDRQMWNWC